MANENKKKRNRQGVELQKPSESESQLSRKVLRKQSRLHTKARRHEYASKRRFGPRDREVVEDDEISSPFNFKETSKKVDNKVQVVAVKKAKKIKKNPEQQQLERKRKLLLEDNLREDKDIKALEKKLKINRGKKSNTVPRVLVEDGLDYILEVCDMENGPNLFDADNMSDGDSDFNDDFELAMGKIIPHTSHDEMKKVKSKTKKVKFCLTASLKSNSPKQKRRLVKDDDFPRTSDEEILTTNEKCPDKSSLKDISTYDEISEEHEEVQKPNRKKRKQGGPKEDIYGRLVNEEGDLIGNKNIEEKRYVPPALRNKAPNDVDVKKTEVVIKLRRQLKGLLNRLSEANMISISNEIEELFMKNIRNDMNESLVHLIFEAVIQTAAITPERLIQEHAFLIALLHANIGSEVGAHFLESTARKLNSLITSGGNYGVGKESDNALLLLIHLYTLQIADSSLIYDVVGILSERFQEKDVDLILLILRSSGFSLRKDDPVALKEMISALQKKAASGSGENDQIRVKFMVETLMAIRNNNMQKIPNYDPTHIEHLRKLLRNIIRKGKSVVQLKVSWADLISTEARGRWWIVGSAWSNQDAAGDVTKSDDAKQSLAVGNVSEDIITCARKQRISTDDRKNIFCILMTAEDYVDAFEKLMRLGLKNQQERNIIYVVIDCCLQERTFNRFYVYLMNRFCDTHRKYKIMVQYAVWDRIKEIQSATPIQLSNLAHLLSRLFIFKALSLTTLKIIEFADMNKTLMSFLRQILFALCLHEPEEESREVFTRVASQSKNHTLCEGLRLFIDLFMIKGMDKGKNLKPDVAVMLESRISAVRKILADCETPVKL